MIKLKDILKELEVGDELFTDVFAGLNNYRVNLYSKELPSLLSKWGLKGEENTKEEDKLLDNIAKYIEIANSKNKGNLAPYLNELLSLKSKFPYILDPFYSNKNIKEIYRGMSLNTDKVASLFEKWWSKSGQKPLDEIFSELRKKFTPNWAPSPLGAFAEAIYYGDKWKPLPGFEYNQMVKSRNKDFMSFSANMTTAGDFATGVSNDYKLPEDSVGVVVGANALDNSSKLLFNPDFLNTMRNDNEDEIMYVGSEIFANKIYLTNYDSIFRVLKNLYDKAYKKSL
jgi:hypothetical protein